MTHYVIFYFGDKWDVPMLDEGDSLRVEQVPLPTHLSCTNCGESFVEGDRGLLRPVLGLDGEGQLKLAAREGGVHAECDMRAMIGHQFQACDCYLPTLSWREQGRQVWERVNEQRRAGGLGPL